MGNVIKLFWDNLCHYQCIPFSFDLGYAPKGINCAKKVLWNWHLIICLGLGNWHVPGNVVVLKGVLCLTEWNGADDWLWLIGFQNDKIKSHLSNSKRVKFD